MEIPGKILEWLLGKITDPFVIILFVIIYWLFKMLNKREDFAERLRTSIDALKDQMAKNRDIQSSVLTLVEVLVYGKRTDNPARKRDEVA